MHGLEDLIGQEESYDEENVSSPLSYIHHLPVPRGGRDGALSLTERVSARPTPGFTASLEDVLI